MNNTTTRNPNVDRKSIMLCKNNSGKGRRGEIAEKAQGAGYQDQMPNLQTHPAFRQPAQLEI